MKLCSKSTCRPPHQWREQRSIAEQFSKGGTLTFQLNVWEPWSRVTAAETASGLLCEDAQTLLSNNSNIKVVIVYADRSSDQGIVGFLFFPFKDGELLRIVLIDNFPLFKKNKTEFMARNPGNDIFPGSNPSKMTKTLNFNEPQCDYSSFHIILIKSSRGFTVSFLKLLLTGAKVRRFQILHPEALTYISKIMFWNETLQL